ncbi:MAG: dethiobiotin synthase [Campylobacterota bacterium]|nr:dethiobiotin synthase [Campylobacterota bacterium]
MQKEIYFITATNTDVGKSYASEVFLNRFAKDGKKVGYYKPIETGVTTTPLDGTKLLAVTKQLNPDFTPTLDDVVPYQFKLPAAPFVAKNNTTIDIDFIIQNTNKLLKQCDILIVEGAGGLMVPIERNYFIIDLILEFQKEFNSKTILISPSNLGSINDTMLSQKALESYNIKYDWYINLYKDKKEFKDVTLPFYKVYFQNNLKFLHE